VRLEEKCPALAITLPHGPHVGTARRALFCLYFEASLLQIFHDKPGDIILVAFRLFGTVDAGDADEFLRQAHEFLAIDPTQYVFDHASELDVYVRLRQLELTGSGPSVRPLRESLRSTLR
jgi:hypothetical protein